MKCFALQKVIFSQESFKLSVHIQLSYMVMIFCFVSIYIYIKINAFCSQGHLIKLVIGVHYLKKKWQKMLRMWNLRIFWKLLLLIVYLTMNMHMQLTQLRLSVDTVHRLAILDVSLVSLQIHLPVTL